MLCRVSSTRVIVAVLVAAVMVAVPFGGSPAWAASSSFVDVPDSATFYPEISWLAAQGVSTGYDAGGGARAFRPADPVLREQMAAFMYRLAGRPVFVAPEASPFVDVGPGATFYREIAWLSAEGVSTGYDAGGGRREFRPGQPVLREQMAAFMYRLAGSPAYTPPPVSPFSDVSTSATFYPQIAWLASLGISTGYDAGAGRREFRPGQPVLREQMAAFMYRLDRSVNLPGTVWAWGANHFGDLGDGTTTDRARPVQVAGISDVRSIDGGLVARTDGTVWAWGTSWPAPLVGGLITPRPLPAQVAGLADVVEVAEGFRASFALDSSGRVWAWGANFAGQLGDGTTTDRYAPALVPGLSGVVAIAAHESAGFALLDDGTVRTWGWCDNPAQSDGVCESPTLVPGLSDVVAITAGSEPPGWGTGYALRADGTVWAWGANEAGEFANDTLGRSWDPVQVPDLADVVQIDSSGWDTYARTADGAVWAWGYDWSNASGMATGAAPSRVGDLAGVVDIAAGYLERAYALDSDGSVWAWGSNDNGLLGTGAAATSTFTTTPSRVIGLSGVRDIAAASSSAYAVIGG